MDYIHMQDATSIITKINLEKDPIEKATLIQELRKTQDMAIKDIANLLKVSSPYVCNMIRLLALPDLVLEGYASGLLSTSHLMILSRLKKEDDLRDVYEQVLQESASTQRTEQLVQEKLYGSIQEGDKITSDEKKEIIKKIKSIDPEIRVRVVHTHKSARVQILSVGNRKKTLPILKKLNKIITYFGR